MNFNPFDGIKPSLGPFAPVLSNPIGILLALIWAGGLIWAAIALVINFAGLAKARRGDRPHQADQSFQNIMISGGSIILLFAAPVIYAVFARMSG